MNQIRSQLFRAWDKENKIYVYGEIGDSVFKPAPYSAEGVSTIDIIRNDNNRFIVEQDTGFSDRTGTEIFDGDKVDCKGFSDKVKHLIALAVYNIEERQFELFINEDTKPIPLTEKISKDLYVITQLK